MIFDKAAFFKRKKYSIFLFLIILMTWIIFVDLVAVDWISLEKFKAMILSEYAFEMPRWKVFWKLRAMTSQRFNHASEMSESLRVWNFWEAQGHDTVL